MGLTGYAYAVAMSRLWVRPPRSLALWGHDISITGQAHCIDCNMRMPKADLSNELTRRI
jgi:hypothetical protein